MALMPDAALLNQLFATIASRKGKDAQVSYTASLFAKGRAKVAQKLGEEAIETVIEAMKGDREGLARESADLLYHLLVVWAEAGLDPAEVWSVLERRMNTSGHKREPVKG